ncbi:MAG: hypothetical protein ACLFSW_02725 [Halobacteriales archaeon]
MEFVDRKEVIAVMLLAIGILLFANPAYTQGQSASAAQVQVGQEINPDNLTVQQLTQIRQDATSSPVVEYERLNNESRSIFDTGRQDVYHIREEEEAENAVLQSAILYRDSVYIREVEETEQGVELRYVNASEEIDANIVIPSLMSDEQRSAFDNATESGSVNLSSVDRGLLGYDYVYDNETETYYETSSETRGNVTVFSVEQTDTRSVIGPAFTGTDEMDDDVREIIVEGIDGEEPVVTGELLSEVQQYQLVEHEDSYYQLEFGQATPPIDEVFGPLNFAGMGAGVLFLLAGAYMVRRVYIEKTENTWSLKE